MWYQLRRFSDAYFLIIPNYSMRPNFSLIDTCLLSTGPYYTVFCRSISARLVVFSWFVFFPVSRLLARGESIIYLSTVLLFVVSSCGCFRLVLISAKESLVAFVFYNSRMGHFSYIR